MPWGTPVTVRLEDGSCLPSISFVRLGGAFGDRVAVVDRLDNTIMSVPVANSSGFTIIFSDTKTI
jgi:hypothetical protein